MTQAQSPRFSSIPALLRRFDQISRSLAFDAKTPRAFQAWRRKLLAKLKSLTGYDTMRTCPLRPRITETREFPDYVRQRVEIQTEPGVVMPLYVLVPKARKSERLPAILCPHGHVSGGKLAVVNDDAGNAKLREMIDLHNYDYGVQFCRAGFITFCPDARGFGERRERYFLNDILQSSCQYLNQAAYPLGQTVTGMWAWDLRRLVDYAESRADCDGGRIGCAGLSGGGLQALWAGAFDDRIQAAVVSGYFYGYKESLLEMYNCSCNYIPHLYEYADIGDIAATLAPRPLLIETGDKDALNGASGLKNVVSQVAVTRRAYKLLGAGEHLVHDVFAAGHRWHGELAIPFMQRHLQA